MNSDETSEWEEAEVGRPVICPTCGTSVLPPERPGDDAVCENGSCDAFGEPVG